MRIFTADEVHAALPWTVLVEHLSKAFAAGAHAPVRHAHALGGPDALLLMPAWSDAVVGVKLVTVMPGNATRGLATVQATYLLLDRASGQPLAMLDGEALTLRRTAAASALAARYLARPGARCLLIVGTGQLAGWMARAHHATQPGLERVLVWGRSPQARAALAETLARESMAATPCDDLEAAVRCVDIISCATTSTEPLVRGAWLQPGTHLDLVGGFKPDMREVDDDAVAMARIGVDTYAGALSEAGDLVQPLRDGRITREHIVAELAELTRNEAVVRRSPDDITLFKSVGTALEDLAAAQLVWTQMQAASR
ncbi:ornithine cyclodeaminase family protein [Comamonadaceae bacterium G21597-S1]|nr:ornithine cyclodeaminase family protein [Comamonadaceae bacterium G21597-S1]